MFTRAPKQREELIIVQAPGSSGYTQYSPSNFGAAGGPLQQLTSTSIGTLTSTTGALNRDRTVFVQGVSSEGYRIALSKTPDGSNPFVEWWQTPALNFGSVSLTFEPMESCFFSAKSVGGGYTFACLGTRSDMPQMQVITYQSDTAAGTNWWDGNLDPWQVTSNFSSGSPQLTYASNCALAGNGDLFYIYRLGATGTGEFRRKGINVVYDLVATFTPAIASGGSIKNITLTTSGQLVGFDPLSSSMYYSNDHGSNWTRSVTTTLRNASAAVRYPADEPLGVKAIIYDATGSTGSTRRVQALNRDGSLSTIQVLPSGTFLYGISDVQFCRGYWIVGARTSGTVVNYYRTKSNIFTTTTVVGDWEQVTSISAGNGLGNTVWVPWR